jgi:hypothetical protein
MQITYSLWILLFYSVAMLWFKFEAMYSRNASV